MRTLVLLLGLVVFLSIALYGAVRSSPKLQLHGLYYLEKLGGGIDDGVYVYVSDQKDRYLPVIGAMIVRSRPNSLEEKVALNFGSHLAEECVTRRDVLKKYLFSDSYETRRALLSVIHRTWDSIPIGEDGQVSARLIQPHDEPNIEVPPESWMQFGGLHYDGFIDAYDGLPEAIRGVAKNLTSKSRIELLYWLEAVLQADFSDDQLSGAISRSGANLYFESQNLSDHFVDVTRWIAEAEYEVLEESCP